METVRMENNSRSLRIEFITSPVSVSNIVRKLIRSYDGVSIDRFNWNFKIQGHVCIKTLSIV